MRRRRRSVIIGIGMLLSTSGNASLEADCYFAGGYFGASYFGANYFDESCTGPEPTPGDGEGNQKGPTVRGVSQGIGG